MVTDPSEYPRFREVVGRSQFLLGRILRLMVRRNHFPLLEPTADPLLGESPYVRRGYSTPSVLELGIALVEQRSRLNLALLERWFCCNDSIVNVCAPTRVGLRTTVSPRSFHQNVANTLHRSVSKCSGRLRWPELQPGLHGAAQLTELTLRQGEARHSASKRTTGI
jgi:hypothetical protein